MATIKVFSTEGVKELNCFDTLVNTPFVNVPLLNYEEEPFDDLAQMESE